MDTFAESGSAHQPSLDRKKMASKYELQLTTDSTPLTSSESFDSARPRIDSTGLGRPRIDSSVDLGNKLDPPTPDSASGRNQAKRRSRTDSSLEYDSDHTASSDRDQGGAPYSAMIGADPPTRRVEQHMPYRQPAPMLRPPRPLPHQRKRAAPDESKKRAAEAQEDAAVGSGGK